MPPDEAEWYRALKHEHFCPQCEQTWICAGEDCKATKERWCPGGDLCHIPWPNDGTYPKPKRRRPSRGVGPLFHELADPEGRA